MHDRKCAGVVGYGIHFTNFCMALLRIYLFLNESNSGDWWQLYFTLFLTLPEFGRYEFSCRHVADRSTPLHYSLTNADFSLQCSSSLDVLSLVYPPYIIQGYL